MLLTVTTTSDPRTTAAAPASDLGFLLHKHPAKLQSFEVSVGTAHVFYPEAGAQRCTAALLLEVDPIALVRGRQGPASEGFELGQYVNDRPYAASSMLAMALAKVFRTAMTGRCDQRPELAASALDLHVHIPALPCRGGADLARRIFAPLGWTVDARAIALDPQIPRWGDSRYVDLRLSGTVRLADALNQLYVLLPVLDDAKHYWVSTDEVDKLVRAGGGWLAEHPERDLITHRYLAHRSLLARAALVRLAEIDDATPDTFDAPDPSTTDDTNASTERSRPVLAEARLTAVLAQLDDARRVADLGCGEGRLVAALLADARIETVVATDVSVRALEYAARKLGLDRMVERQRQRLDILQSSLVYRDDRLTGLDAAVLMEVIEHVDPARLPALARTVFGHAAPGRVVVTTPNAEHNVRFAGLAALTMRHRDHRFEWTRAQFATWAGQIGGQYGYDVGYHSIGPDDDEVGPPTQMAVFRKIVA